MTESLSYEESQRLTLLMRIERAQRLLDNCTEESNVPYRTAHLKSLQKMLREV